MAFQKITEQESRYHKLESMSVYELLVNINAEDSTVPAAVSRAIPQIEKLVENISDKMLMGGIRWHQQSPVSHWFLHRYIKKSAPHQHFITYVFN